MKWTKEDEELLYFLKDNAVSVDKIAEALNRTKSSVNIHWHRMKHGGAYIQQEKERALLRHKKLIESGDPYYQPRHYDYKFWRDEEIETLKECIARGDSKYEIAKQLDRSVSSVTSYIFYHKEELNKTE